MIQCFVYAGVAVIGLLILAKLKKILSLENRQRLFADFCKDFPEFHNAKTLLAKRKLFEPLHGRGKEIRVLEIGAGSGANLEFYPENTLLTVVDINPFFKEHLLKSLEKHPHVKLENYVVCKAEDMKAIPDHSFDAVVSTIVLCSVTDPQRIFREIRRVLVPGGQFYFLEHVIDNKLSLVKLGQETLSRLGIWPFIFGGCCCNRDTEKEIRRGGFAAVDTNRIWLDLRGGFPLRFWSVLLITPHLYGVATTGTEDQ